MMTLPATLEGRFSISVEKGDVDDNGVSELNFGVLAVNGVEHLVQVSGPVLSAARLPREGGKVRATLGFERTVNRRADSRNVPWI